MNRNIIHASVWQPTRTDKHPRIILEGAVWQNRVSVRVFCCPAKGQPLQESSGGFSLVPAVLHTSARANLGRVEEKSSRYAKARVQIPNNPAGWLNTQAWGLAVASMGIRYIRGDAEDLPLPAFGVGGGFKVKNIKGG